MAYLNGDSHLLKEQLESSASEDSSSSTRGKILGLTSYSSRLEEVLLELLKEQQILKDKSTELSEKLDNQVEISNGLQDRCDKQAEESHELQNRLDHEMEKLKGDIEGVKDTLQDEIQGKLQNIPQIVWLMASKTFSAFFFQG